MSGVNRELKWYTYAGDFFNTLKAFIGTNYQSLPFAFANSGLGFGIGGLFIVAMLTDHCIQIMLRCKNVFIEKICSNSVAVKSVDDADVPRLRERLQLSVSYGDLGQKVYGSWCFHLIQFAVWFTQFMTCIGYFIFIGNTVYEMFPLREPPPQNSSNLTGDGTLMDSNDDVNDGVQFSVYSHLADLPDTLLLGERNATVIYVSTAPDLRIIVTWCIPIFIVTSLVRKVRYLAPLSFIATIALVLGILSVLAFLISGFTISNFVWYRFETLPMFLTQMISAYEGIGCILPIHCSMVGCRHMLSRYVHANVYIIFVILGVFGTLGYMRYGPNVEQILVKEITQHTLLSLLVDATLIVSVIFTYPLQCYPVIEIMESYLLAPGACCRKTHSDRLEYDEITVDSPESVLPLSEGSPLVHENASVELTASQISTTVALPRVASWKRNVLRVTLTLVVALLAVLLRNNYAYLASFTGALGCSLLSFILPCLIELKLRGSEMSYICIVKDITIIVLSVIISIAGLISVIVTLAQGRKPV